MSFSLVVHIVDKFVAKKMHCFVFIFCLLYCTATPVLCHFCYWNTGCPYKYFSLATPYNFVRGDIRDSFYVIVDSNVCEVKSLWMVSRNGKPTPSHYVRNRIKDAIKFKKLIQDSHAKGNSLLCSQDVDNLNMFEVVDTNFNKEERLTDEGVVDLQNIAKRLKYKFNNIVSNLNSNNYVVSSDTGNIFKESLRAFVDGLNNEKDKPINSLIIKSTNDNMMTLFNITNNEEYLVESNKESEKFVKSTEFTEMIHRMKYRMGLEDLSIQNITALYEICRHTSSGVTFKFSPWCAIFTSADLKTLEYLEDLKVYYQYGFGNEKGKKVGVSLLKDLYSSFESARNNDKLKFTGYFVGFGILNNIYSALNIFKDETKLTADNKPKERKWRSSYYSGFGANFIAILSKCRREDSEEHMVSMYVNERPLMELCGDGLCTWEEFDTIIKQLNCKL